MQQHCPHSAFLESLLLQLCKKAVRYCIRMSDILTEKQQYILGNSGNIDYTSE